MEFGKKPPVLKYSLVDLIIKSERFRRVKILFSRHMCYESNGNGERISAGKGIAGENRILFYVMAFY
jgi:hypothetical protein